MRWMLAGLVFGLAVGLLIGWFGFRPRNAEKKIEPRKILYYRNPMNPAASSPVPMKDEMGMDYIPVYSDEVQQEPRPSENAVWISPAFVQNIGVVTETVEKRTLTHIIRTSGTLAFDERKVYFVNSKIMGWVDKLYVNYTGQYVKRGQALFSLYSPDLVSAEQEYLEAIKYLKEMQQSGSQESVKTAEMMIDSAKKRLLYWDIPMSEITRIEESGTAKKTMTIISPDKGVVVEKIVIQGQQVMPGMPIYKIADLSTVWVMGPIYQYDLPWVKLGQQAMVSISYLPGRTFEGSVTFIAPTINEETKTGSVRVELANSKDFELKPGMFTTVELSSALPEKVIAVPDQAVIRSGEQTLAVVSLGNGYFEPRDVELGVTGQGYVQVLNGISEGENIVVSSQFLIDSESNLKAAVSQMTLHHNEGSTVTAVPSDQAPAPTAKPPEKKPPASKKHEDAPAMAPMPGMTGMQGMTAAPSSTSDSMQHHD